MKKIILISILVFISLFGIARANDSLFISTKEYQVLNNKIIHKYLWIRKE